MLWMAMEYGGTQSRPAARNAEELLEGLKLENVELDTAVSAIMDAPTGKSYLAQGGTVSIFVTAESTRRADALEHRGSDQVTGLLPEMQLQTDPAPISPPYDEDGIPVKPDDWDDD